jgi:hypothetical protein
LERWAARELTDHQLQKLEDHVAQCQACKARSAEWAGLFLALNSLRGVELPVSFDEAVLERVRLPSEVDAPERAWLPALARRLRPVAAAAAGLWSVGVVGGGAWLLSRADIPIGLLLSRLLGYGQELALAATIKLAAAIQLSGIVGWWTETTGTMPGVGLAAIAALVTALSSLALWTLYRVGFQPSGMNQHA